MLTWGSPRLGLCVGCRKLLSLWGLHPCPLPGGSQRSPGTYRNLREKLLGCKLQTCSQCPGGIWVAQSAECRGGSQVRGGDVGAGPSGQTSY